jgi:hypothetical protein
MVSPDGICPTTIGTGIMDTETLDTATRSDWIIRTGVITANPDPSR